MTLRAQGIEAPTDPDSLADEAHHALTQRARSGPFVVKIGSSVLAAEGGGLDPARVSSLAEQIATLASPKHWPVVVSSGAILAGVGALGLAAKPKTMAGLQAAAAVGQSKLVEAWSLALQRARIPVAQVLLTHADLADRTRFLNARRAIAEISKRRAIAVINENDTVSTEEIAFGDNDGLAAQVANLVDASVLVLLTVAPGLLNTQGDRVRAAFAADPKLDGMLRADKSKHGKGGMGSKLDAARAAAARGAIVVIAPGTEASVLVDLFSGKDVGTILLPRHGASPMKSRAHWIAYTLRARGTLIIDRGAAHAITRDGRSLLPSGITGVEGEFEAGDAVSVTEGVDRRVLARGLVRKSARDLRASLGAKRMSDEAIHKDDLVVLV
ncbi:MAG: glutamate 5-kinase [Deltaproteobacteria bacterium]|nr:glutamate 5-kinase [Deltaproteobacteria bacterium]